MSRNSVETISSETFFWKYIWKCFLFFITCIIFFIAASIFLFLQNNLNHNKMLHLLFLQNFCFYHEFRIDQQWFLINKKTKYYEILIILFSNLNWIFKFENFITFFCLSCIIVFFFYFQLKITIWKQNML